MNVNEFDRAHLWRFRAEPIRVIDADTIKVLADCGYRGRYEPALRLEGIKAAEKWTPEGRAAAAWLRDEIGECVAGRPGDRWPLRVETVQLETVVEEATTFERWVARVWLVDADGELHDLGDRLVTAGWAVRVEPP